MKRILSILILLGFTIVLVSCDEDNLIVGDGECLEVTLVDELCGQAVFKIQNPSFYDLGETANGEENVFFGLLTCRDMDSNMEGSFLIELTEEYDPGGCAVCEALLVYDGDKKYNVRRVDVCAAE